MDLKQLQESAEKVPLLEQEIAEMNGKLQQVAEILNAHPMLKEHLFIQDVADYLNITRQTARKYMLDMGARKLGKKMLFVKRSDFDSFMERQELNFESQVRLMKRQYKKKQALKFA